mmetsp:Transcript_47083/g.147676  ORF Transcript_47083/g.147676 Transcript_47083/m.147676 type:complete len:566 (-) Transcript_47083:175-1872(-)
MAGLAAHFQVMYHKLAELEARVEQLESTNKEQEQSIQVQAKRLAEQASLLQAGAAPHEEAQLRRRVSSEEQAAALRRGQHRALGALLRDSQAGGKRGIPLWPSCAHPRWEVSMGDHGMTMNYGHYHCTLDYDLGYFGSGGTELFDMDLNFGYKEYPKWLDALHVFQKIGKKVRKLIPTLPDLFSTTFDELCKKVVGYLRDPTPGPALLAMDNRQSSVHVYTKEVRGFSALATSSGRAAESQHPTIIDKPPLCLFFKKDGEKPGTDFMTLKPYYGPCEDIGQLSPQVSLGVQAKIEPFKPHQCYNLTNNFNLPIAAAAGAGVVFDILPPTLTTNFWACFADFAQILEGKGSLAVFGLEVKAFGLEVVDTEVPIENPLGKWSCSVAGVQESAEEASEAAAAVNGSRVMLQKPSVSMREISMDMRSKTVSKVRSLKGDEAAALLGRAMRHRSPESLSETDAAAGAQDNAQRLFEVKLGDDVLHQEKPGDLTIIDTEAVGLSLRGSVSGGKLSIGIDMHVGDVLNFNDDFELLDFHELVKSGMSAIGCVNPCFQTAAIAAWEKHIEGLP